MTTEELIARFVIAYHQSEGGPWCQTPAAWLQLAIMHRRFSDFIQARRAGRGLEPEWHVVRHLLTVRETYRQVIRLEGHIHTPVLARQAARMFAGQFDESLALPTVHQGSMSAAGLPAPAAAHPTTVVLPTAWAQGQPMWASAGGGPAQLKSLQSSQTHGGNHSGSILPGPQATGVPGASDCSRPASLQPRDPAGQPLGRDWDPAEDAHDPQLYVPVPQAYIDLLKAAATRTAALPEIQERPPPGMSTNPPPPPPHPGRAGRPTLLLLNTPCPKFLSQSAIHNPACFAWSQITTAFRCLGRMRPFSGTINLILSGRTVFQHGSDGSWMLLAAGLWHAPCP